MTISKRPQKRYTFPLMWPRLRHALTLIHKEIKAMALTIQDIKNSVQANADTIAKLKQELTDEIKALQADHVTQADLDQINAIAAQTAADAKAIHDLIPDAPTAPGPIVVTTVGDGGSVGSTETVPAP